MKRGWLSIAALSLFCVGYAFDSNEDLSKREEALTKRLTELVLAPGSEASMSEEIASIRKELNDVKAEIAKQNQKHTDQTNHGWFSGFFQSQYFSTDRDGQQSGLFRARRERLNYNHMGDNKTMGRISVEFTAGASNSSAQLRDAFIQYRPGTYLANSGPSFTIGQQNTPLGYEISYPSWARTWPERSVYEQTYFSGERGKGLIYQNGDTSNYWYVGAWDALTVNDPEQVDTTPKGEVGPIGGVHAKRGAWEGGLSGYSGKRPNYVSGSTNLATTDRQFFFADLRYHPANSKFDLRSEYMVGKDRVPLSTSAVATDASGFHVNLDYKANAEDTVVLRYENFDRDTNLSGNLQTLYGIAMVKDVNPFLRVTLATDWNKNPTLPVGQTSYRTLTFRVQFKF